MWSVDSRGRGFTLIELLVVIAIIGILASVVLASLNSAREKAQVARMASDLREIHKALELYYSANGAYPCFDHNWNDAHERAMTSPYYSWPKTPWNTPYHWEHNQSGLARSISIQSVGDGPALALDEVMDDGNLSTGMVRGSGTRLEYGGLDQTGSSPHCDV